MKRRHLHPLFLTLYFSVWFPTLRAQTVAVSDESLTPGPKPADAPAEWKQLVGVYGKGESAVILLERDGELIWHQDKSESTIQGLAGLKFTVPLQDRLSLEVTVHLDSHSNVQMLEITPRLPHAGCSPPKCYQIVEPHLFRRTDASADPSHFYHITPSKPLDQLRETALAATPPGEPGPFRRPALVELAPLDPGIHLDIRYATANDFLGTLVYSQARAFLERPAAEALLRVQQKLKPLRYGLLIHDAYRPWYVTKIFWDATPPEGKIFVADPAQGSRHNRGCAVDLTLYDLPTGKPVEMPGTYDEMSPRSFPDYPGGTSLQRWHRDLLRRAMESEGFTVYEAEWWHFDYKDWKEYPILNVPFEKLGLDPAADTAH